MGNIPLRAAVKNLAENLARFRHYHGIQEAVFAASLRLPLSTYRLTVGNSNGGRGHTYKPQYDTLRQIVRSKLLPLEIRRSAKLVIVYERLFSLGKTLTVECLPVWHPRLADAH